MNNMAKKAFLQYIDLINGWKDTNPHMYQCGINLVLWMDRLIEIDILLNKLYNKDFSNGPQIDVNPAVN